MTDTQILFIGMFVTFLVLSGLAFTIAEFRKMHEKHEEEVEEFKQS